MQVFQHVGVRKFVVWRERHVQVEHGQRVAQATIGLAANQFKSLAVGDDVFLLGDLRQMVGDVGGANAIEVENLTARQNRWQNFVLFCGGEDENRVARRFFQRFQKRIEGRRG